MIHSIHFYDLLDCLAGQFFDTDYAECVRNEFGISISSNAKEYFSVAIIAKEGQRWPYSNLKFISHHLN
jgi:hypothetical protein